MPRNEPRPCVRDQVRFDLALFIVHPSMAPDEITEALGVEPTHVHPVGKPRVTPFGTPLGGTYQDNRWRHSKNYSVDGQWFAKELSEFVARFAPQQAFLLGLGEGGGTACIIVSFLGDGHYSDKIEHETLGLLVELGLSLGIEAYDVPQT